MASRPTGTVTFLFTDIEGSTRALQRLGDAYAGLLSDHHRLIRASIAAWGGDEVSTEGDAFFVVFSSAPDAVRAAVDAQRTLAAHAWPEGLPVKVRMGIHTGEATLTGDDYVGLDIHRAARIAAAGHGGQIVISDAVRHLIAGRLDDEVGIRDLGEHRLRDLERPEHLYQLVIPGIPERLPAHPVRVGTLPGPADRGQFVHRTRTGGGSRLRPAVRHTAPDLDRPRWHRQDPAVVAGRGGRRGRLRRRRGIRASRCLARRAAGRLDHPAVAGIQGGGRASVDRHHRRGDPRPRTADRARQLRAGDASGRDGGAIAVRHDGHQGHGHEPRTAAHLG